MSARVLSMVGRGRAGRYYFRLPRYAYVLWGYLSAREFYEVLFGVSLISAAPFFYLLITHEVMPCVVFTVNATAGALIGVWNFKKTSGRTARRVQTDAVPPRPSVARRVPRAA